MPIYMSKKPETETPKILKLTESKGGILMSASLARALIAPMLSNRASGTPHLRIVLDNILVFFFFSLFGSSRNKIESLALWEAGFHVKRIRR